MVKMTLWDEIDDSRKKKETIYDDPRGFTLVQRGRGKRAPFTDFSEIEDRARQAIEEYVSKRGTKISEELERKACTGVLGYLLTYSHDPGKCTEYHISQMLGIPRMRLNRLMSRMEWDGIIESVGIGTSSPYNVSNLGKAMKDGYLELGPEEAEKVVKITHSPWTSIQLLRESLVSSLPESELFTETIMGIENAFQESGREIEPIHIPFIPGRGVYYIPGQDDFWISLEFLRGLIHGQLSKEVLMELDVPEEVKPEDVRIGLRRVAEKYLKLVRRRIKPLLNLLEEHGFNEGKMMVEKAYLKEKLLKQNTDPEGRAIPRIEIRRGEKLIDERAVVPGHGEVSLQTQELTPSHIRLLANVYRATSNFAEIAGGDPQLITICRKEADQLESYTQPGQDLEKQEDEE
jgi:hypothetical protein